MRDSGRLALPLAIAALPVGMVSMSTLSDGMAGELSEG